MITCTFNPMTHKVVPIKITEDMKMASDINSVYSAEEQYKFILDVAPEYPADAGWISVDERLPELFVDVLLHPRPNEYTVSGWMTTTNFMWKGFSFDEHEKITHWMPLPPAPESK
jgi:hypothetical protein